MILQERKDLIRRAMDKFQHLETCPERSYTFMENSRLKKCGVGCPSCMRIVELPNDESPKKWAEAFYEVDIDNRGGGNVLDELK